MREQNADHVEASSREDDLYQLRLLSWFYFWWSTPGLGMGIGCVLYSDIRASRWCAGLALYGIAVLITGFSLRVRRLRWFSLIVAGATTLIIPLGTILGLSTIAVLRRPSARALY